MLRRSSLLLGRRAGGRGLASAISIPGTPRVLQDVAKIELLQPEAPARITAIWESFHKEQPNVAGVAVGPEEAASIVERGGESPNFVFPLRRDGGHFMLFSQFAPAHRMFVLTFLEDYRRAPEMAQPWASVHLFDELLAVKGVGLLRAEIAPERLTTAEAEHLLLLVQRYYGTSHYDKVWARPPPPPPIQQLGTPTDALVRAGVGVQPRRAALRLRRLHGHLPVTRTRIVGFGPCRRASGRERL